MSVPIMDHLTKTQQEMGHGDAPVTSTLQNVPVLLIEDEPDIAEEIAKELTNLGYVVRVAETEAGGSPRPAAIRPGS